MLNVSIIGMGNTGNQVASLANEELKIPAMAINSSEKDLESVSESIPKKLISSKEGKSQGAGKNRKLAKEYLKDSVMSLLSDEDTQNFIGNSDVLFIVSSTGGGTGSGTALVMSKIVSQMFAGTTKVITIGVLPVMSEALSAHVNTLEYLNELYSALDNSTYMLYDNDRYSNLPSYKMMEKVNHEIVKDIDVLRCTYNYSTPYDSIDEQDMKRLISFPGRLAVARLEDIKERDLDEQTIEDLLIKKIKTFPHVEMQRDQKITATGVIANLSDVVFDEFDNHIPNVIEFIGSPDHDFNHISRNEDRKMPNNVFLIMSGLSAVNDRILKLTDRIDEIEEKQKIREEEAAIDASEIKGLSDQISSKDGEKESETKSSVDLESIFDEFGV
jgi:cell division GTPase FtsZ